MRKMEFYQYSNSVTIAWHHICGSALFPKNYEVDVEMLLWMTNYSMGKECATVDTKLSQSEAFIFKTRENILKACLEKRSPTLQTLMSMRALKIHLNKGSLLEPKHLHHVRYLDLSSSDIEALLE
ncbi:LOW QUALITY PROTEIN: hypothetical protein U9M48_030080 [Paspalum notatum var. saurae]|uniref:Uncharacterized protein n=1 Tax=Paspalum notatum var. saurae TaxID=547442 RepID=A0AAQ3X2X8_PASNO